MFHAANELKTTHKSLCKECDVSYNREMQRKRALKAENEDRRRELNGIRKAERRQFIKDYLSCHPCVDCGYTNVDALEFDHVRGIKKYNISHMVANKFTLRDIELEILKCDVRCRNCHIIRTRKVTKEMSEAGLLKKPKKRSITDPPKQEMESIYMNAYAV